jgi:hypothetical protein
MRKQKGRIRAEVHFGESVRPSHQIRSGGVRQATPGTIHRQGVPGLARNRWLPQSGHNKTRAGISPPDALHYRVCRKLCKQTMKIRGAGRPMQMGTIPSLFLHDIRADAAPESPRPRRPANSRYAVRGRDNAGYSPLMADPAPANDSIIRCPDYASAPSWRPS